MKIPVKLIFRLTLLLAVLFCLGQNICSDFTSPGYTLELSAETTFADNEMNTGADAFDDDQINQEQECPSILEPMFWLPESKDQFSLYMFTFSSWQPPKNAASGFKS